jgi:hypothetical protein
VDLWTLRTHAGASGGVGGGGSAGRVDCDAAHSRMGGVADSRPVQSEWALGTATDLTLTRPFDPLGTGVTTDEQTRVGAWIMMGSTLPFLFAQLPLLPWHLEDGPMAALGGYIVATVGLLAYSAFQVSRILLIFFLGECISMPAKKRC